MLAVWRTKVNNPLNGDRERSARAAVGRSGPAAEQSNEMQSILPQQAQRAGEGCWRGLADGSCARGKSAVAA